MPKLKIETEAQVKTKVQEKPVSLQELKMKVMDLQNQIKQLREQRMNLILNKLLEFDVNDDLINMRDDSLDAFLHLVIINAKKYDEEYRSQVDLGEIAANE